MTMTRTIMIILRMMINDDDDDNSNNNKFAFQLMMSQVRAVQVLSLQSSLFCASL